MSGIAVIYAGEKAPYPLHVFYRDDANIKHLYWNSEGSHTDNWAGPSSPKHPTPAAGRPTAMFTDSGAMHVFYSDDKGNIYHLYDAPGFGRQSEIWSGTIKDAHITPCTIAGPPNQANPVAVYASEWGKRLHVFFRNDKGDIVETGKDPELGYGQYTWAGPNSDISSTTTATAVGDPVTLHVPSADYNAQYMIFYRDSKGNIVHVAPVEGTGIGVEAQAWNTTPDAASDPVAYCYDNGQRSVFYRNSNGDIVELVQTKDVNLKVPALKSVAKRSNTDAAAVGNPGFAYDRDKKTQNIFYRDGSGNIYRVWWKYTSTLDTSTWKVISGPDESINYTATGDPVAYYTPDDTCLHVFYSSSTKALVHIKLDSSANISAECW